MADSLILQVDAHPRVIYTRAMQKGQIPRLSASLFRCLVLETRTQDSMWASWASTLTSAWTDSWFFLLALISVL